MVKWKSPFEKFEEEYTAVMEPARCKRGFKITYVYYGPWFLWNLPENRLKREKKRILALALAAMALTLTAGWIPTALNSLALVAYPAIVGLFAGAMEVLGAAQFCLARYQTTQSTFRQADRRIRTYSLLHALLSAAAMGGCVWYLVTAGYFPSVNEGLLALCWGLCACLSGQVYRQYKKIPFTTAKNHTLKHVQRVCES